jgi:hypothetical protein
MFLSDSNMTATAASPFRQSSLLTMHDDHPQASTSFSTPSNTSPAVHTSSLPGQFDIVKHYADLLQNDEVGCDK